MQDHRHAAFGIGNTRAIGALTLGAKWPFGHSSGSEYGVVVHHQQEVLITGALEGADDIVPGRRGCRAGLDASAKVLQALDQQRTDLVQARLGAGSGIHRDQGFQGVQVSGLFGPGLGQQRLRGNVGGVDGRADNQRQNGGCGEGKAGQLHR